MKTKVNDYKFTRLLPPPKGSGFPPIRIGSNFYESLLNSKDTTIAELQGQLKVAKELKDAATQTAKEKADEVITLSENVEYWKKELNDKVENYESMFPDARHQS